MKTLFITFGLLTACGADVETYEVRSQPCTVEKIDNTTTITCPDGTTAVVLDGEQGDKGDTGAEGAAGKDGMNGTDGVDGSNGKDGEDGKDAVSPGVFYVGYYCARTIVRVADKFYALHNNAMVLLTKKYYKISSTCEIRVKGNQVQTR